jgi:hypothetical protein
VLRTIACGSYISQKVFGFYQSGSEDSIQWFYRSLTWVLVLGKNTTKSKNEEVNHGKLLR